MKKAVAVILAASMAAGIAGCAKKTETTRARATDPVSASEIADEPAETKARETTEATTGEKAKETTPIPDGMYCLDGMSPEEIVELAKYYADTKDGDTFIDTYSKLKVKPYGVQEDRLEKYDAYGMIFAWQRGTTDFSHNCLYEINYNETSYQSDNHAAVRIYENSYITMKFCFGTEEDCLAAEEAFYNYLVSLGEVDEEQSSRAEETAGASVSKVVFKSALVEDTRNFHDGNDNCKYDKETKTHSFTPRYLIIVQNYGRAGNYLTVDMPVAGNVYKGGK